MFSNILQHVRLKLKRSKPESCPEDSRHPEAESLNEPLRVDVWAKLNTDIRIDVFKCLRAYDIRKSCIYVSKDWREFYLANQSHLPKPRAVDRRTVEQRFSLDECEAFMVNQAEKIREREIQARSERLLLEKQIQRTRSLYFLAITIAVLVNWSSLAFLAIKTGVKTEMIGNLLAVFPYMVLTFVITHDRYSFKGHRLRLWFSWLCFRDTLLLAGLLLPRFFPHLTPALWTTPPYWPLWTAITVLHLSEWALFFSWIDDKINPVECLRGNFVAPNCQGDHLICCIVQRFFMVILSIPHFVALLALLYISRISTSLHPESKNVITCPGVTVITVLTCVIGRHNMSRYVAIYESFLGLILSWISSGVPKWLPYMARLAVFAVLNILGYFNIVIIKEWQFWIVAIGLHSYEIVKLFRYLNRG